MRGFTQQKNVHEKKALQLALQGLFTQDTKQRSPIA